MSRPRSIQWLLVVPLLLYAAWLSARSFNTDAIWLDEYYSIFESGGAHYGPLSPIDLAIRVAGYAVWSPGHNYLLAGWGVIAGWSPLAGRALSWLLGLLAIAVIYRLAREMMPQDRRFALFAAVFISGSAFFIYYLHELRGYTFHVLAGCIATTLYWHLLRKPESWLTRIGFIAALVLLLYSHPVGQLWFAMLAGFHILFEWRGSHWKLILFLFLVAVLFYAPWLAFMLIKASQDVSIPAGTDPVAILGAAGTAFSNWLTLLVAALCVLSLRFLRQKPVQFLWWWLIVVTTLTLLINHFIPFLFHIRHLIAMLPAIVLLAAVGLTQLKQWRWLQGTICTVWLGTGVYLSFTPSFSTDLPGALRMVSRPGFETALHILNQQVHPEDAVIFRLADAETEYLFNPPLQYYLYGSPLHASLLSMVNANSDAPIDDPSFIETPFDERLRNFVGDSPRVWVAAVPDIAPDMQTEALVNFLANVYSLCENVLDLPDIRLDIYAFGSETLCPTSTG